MRQTGQVFEKMAQEFLQNQGLEIICNNYNVPNIGEIDLICRHDVLLPNGKVRPTLVFVEVKMRKKHQFGKAVNTVTPSKQKKLTAAALHFLQHWQEPMDCRFDVVAFDVDGKVLSRQWVQHAFLAQ